MNLVMRYDFTVFVKMVCNNLTWLQKLQLIFFWGLKWTIWASFHGQQQNTRSWRLLFYAILPAEKSHLPLPTQTSTKSIFLQFKWLKVVSLDVWMFSHLLSISIITINKVLSWSTNPDLNKKQSFFQSKWLKWCL